MVVCFFVAGRVSIAVAVIVNDLSLNSGWSDIVFKVGLIFRINVGDCFSVLC